MRESREDDVQNQSNSTERVYVSREQYLEFKMIVGETHQTDEPSRVEWKMQSKRHLDDRGCGA